MTNQPWNVVYFVGFVACTWIRGHDIKRAKTVENVLSRKDTLERTLFGIVLVETGVRWGEIVMTPLERT